MVLRRASSNGGQRAGGARFRASWSSTSRGFPAFADDIPYNAAQVELEEGPRLTTSLVGVRNEDIVVGLEVEAVFDDVDDETTLPRFRPRRPG